ncbi:MAG TPA: NHL repeat-containing protein [Solirubrobacterales bacterium]|nr:NHL repeat-containing protein [Solirubrobacterales bacterium]
MSLRFSHGSPVFLLILVIASTLAVMPAGAGGSQGLKEVDSWGGTWQRPLFSGSGVASSASGDVFVTDDGADRVVKFGPDGQIETSWSTGRPEDGEFGSEPAGVAVDGAENVYVADSVHSSVKKYSPTGSFIKSWYVNSSNPTSLRGIAFESGSIFVLRDSEVKRFDPDGNELDSWGGFETTRFSDPVIAGDADGHLLVAGTTLVDRDATKTIYRFGLDGTPLSAWETPAALKTASIGHSPNLEIVGIKGYEGLAPRGDGGVFASYEGGPNRVESLSPAGTPEGGFGDPAGPAGTLAVTPDSHFWLATESSVDELAADGTRIRNLEDPAFPKYADRRGDGLFNRIDSLSVGTDGRVLATDSGNWRLQRFGPTGEFESLADTPADLPGRVFSIPLGSDENAILDAAGRRLIRYSGTGAEIGRSAVDVDGDQILDALPQGEDVLILSATPLTVSRIDTEGEVVASWRARKIQKSASAAFALTANGGVVIRNGSLIQEYTAEGHFIRGWKLPAPVRQPAQIAVDRLGRVLVLSWGFNASVTRLSATGRPLNTTRVGSPGRAITRMALAPSGDVYLAGETRTHRYTPGPESLEIDAVRISGNGMSARVRLYLPGPGRVSLKGTRTIRPDRAKAGEAGFTTLTVRLRHPSKKRLARGHTLKLNPRFGFSTAGREPQRAGTRIVLRRQSVRISSATNPPG